MGISDGSLADSGGTTAAGEGEGEAPGTGAEGWGSGVTAGTDTEDDGRVDVQCKSVMQTYISCIDISCIYIGITIWSLILVLKEAECFLQDLFLHGN